MLPSQTIKIYYVCVIISELAYIVETATWLDAMSSVTFSGFRSQLESSCVYIHTEELWYNETVCGVGLFGLMVYQPL